MDTPERGPAARSPRLLRHVIEVELEILLQAAFSARQDLGELDGTSADRQKVRDARATLESMTASVRILLALLRALGPSDDTDGLFDRSSAAFAIVSREGEVLYMNAEVSRVVGRDHRAVTATPFADRTWADRDQMRRHIDEAYENGVADDTFAVVRGDGRTIAMRLHTERLDTESSSVLLMNHVPD
jgi:PAS domain S-box-containing protein